MCLIKILVVYKTHQLLVLTKVAVLTCCHLTTQEIIIARTAICSVGFEYLAENTEYKILNAGAKKFCFVG
jgi:hypothetical protein